MTTTTKTETTPKTKIDGEDETYLGDGLYASYDGWQIQLRAPNLLDGTQFVFLEDQVLINFLNYVVEITQERIRYSVAPQAPNQVPPAASGND